MQETPGAGAPEVVIIGAGPAGLTAAYQLAKRAVASTVLEADDVVGGISRTVERDGWRFDIGGHRFFTKVQPVEDLWHEILPPEDFLQRPRMSRIFYKGKYYDYPLKPLNALGTSVRSRRCSACCPTRGRGSGRPRTSATSRAGSRPASASASTSTSSRATTRSSGAVPASEISADFAAQRIKNLTILNAPDLGAEAEAEEQEGPDHVAHRGVPVPEVRARDDVGALPRAGRGRRHQGRHALTGHEDPPRGRQGRRGDGHLGRRHHDLPLRPRHLVDAVLAAAGDHGPAGDAPRSRPPRRASRSATSSPSPSSCPRSTRSRTTGSTSTTPRSRSDASRTSVRGRRTSSRRVAPASASSTSCSRATSSGPCPTTTSSSWASGS